MQHEYMFLRGFGVAVKLLNGIQHLASLSAWIVAIAACFALLLPATTAMSRMLPVLARASIVFDAPEAFSVLQPGEALAPIAAVVPPAAQVGIERHDGRRHR